MPERGKGLLVKRITIKPGDTLGKLSKEFNGKASYYPQILLFNDIKNPHLIRSGRELLVPVTNQGVLARNTAPAKPELQSARKKTLGKAKKPEPTAVKTAIPAEKSPVKRTGKPVLQSLSDTRKNGSKGEQDSYEIAVSEFSKGNYQKAHALFSRFLERHPSSSHAPDASLYKAESLLKLAGQ